MPDTPAPGAKGVSFAGPKPSPSLEELRQVVLKAKRQQSKPNPPIKTLQRPTRSNNSEDSSAAVGLPPVRKKQGKS